MYVCDEMNKVRNWLDAHNIEWEDVSVSLPGMRSSLCRTRVDIGSFSYSIIHGFGTMGGYNRIVDDQGLLEMMTMHDPTLLDSDIVKGYLTADDVIAWISKRHGIREVSHA